MKPITARILLYRGGFIYVNYLALLGYNEYCMYRIRVICTSDAQGRSLASLALRDWAKKPY